MQFIVVALFVAGAWGQDFQNPFDQINADFAKGFPKNPPPAKVPVVTLDVSDALKEARQDLKIVKQKSSLAADQFTIASQDFHGSKVELGQTHLHEAMQLKDDMSKLYKKGAELLAEATSMQTRKVKVTLDDDELQRSAKSGLDALKDQQQDAQEAAHEASSLLQIDAKPEVREFANPFDDINAQFAQPDDGAEAASELKDARKDLQLAEKKTIMAKDQLTVASQEFKGSKIDLAQKHEQEADDLKDAAKTFLAKGTALLSKVKELQPKKVALEDEQLEMEAQKELDALGDREVDEREAAREAQETPVATAHAALVHMKPAVKSDSDQSALEHFLR